MKESTKYKIIDWVKKLLKLSPEQPPFIIEERKIQKIKSEHFVTKLEQLYHTDEEIKKEIGINVLKVMLHIGAIKFEWFDLPNGERKLEATTYVPEKL